MRKQFLFVLSIMFMSIFCSQSYSATLMEINNLVVGTPELQQRFKAARIKAAWDVLNEAPETENHVNRLEWAVSVILDYEIDSQSEYNRFLANTTIQTNGSGSSDNDIIFVVNSLINTFAGTGE